MSPNLNTLELDQSQFDTIRRMVYQLCGINLTDGKNGLVRARLLKRLRALNLPDFDAYLQRIRDDRSGGEIVAMIDVLTTNKTSFFREAQHFDYLQEEVFPAFAGNRRPLRIWCAGCSTGEEPYTLAIVLREAFRDTKMDVKILATDISTRVLEHARAGVYEADKLSEAPPTLVSRYFTEEPGAPRRYRVRPETQKLIQFARLNLMEEWPMRGPFDVIFCRNVMIYFDKETQERLIRRFAALLGPGAPLLVGHSESLTAWSSIVRYVRPAVYLRA